MWEMQAASTCWTAPMSTAAFGWQGWAIWAEESWHLACLLKTREGREGRVAFFHWPFDFSHSSRTPVRYLLSFISINVHTRGFAFACSTIAVCSRGTCPTHNKKGRIQVKKKSCHIWMFPECQVGVLLLSVLFTVLWQKSCELPECFSLARVINAAQTCHKHQLMSRHRDPLWARWRCFAAGWMRW